MVILLILILQIVQPFISVMMEYQTKYLAQGKNILYNSQKNALKILIHNLLAGITKNVNMGLV